MTTYQLLVLGLVGSFIVAGCNHKAEWDESLVDEKVQFEKSSRHQEQSGQSCESDVIFLDKASVDDVNDYVVSCGKSNKASCVVICHVPPGNPEAQHTIVIGLPALHAHMNHGPKKGHKHDHKDYLGECRDLGELPPCEEEPTPTTTTTTMPPAPTTTTTTLPPVPTTTSSTTTTTMAPVPTTTTTTLPPLPPTTTTTSTTTTTTLPPVPTTTTTTLPLPPPTTTTTTTTTTLPPVPTTTTTTSTTTTTLPPVPTTTTTTTTSTTTTTTLPSGGECVPSDEIFYCP